MIVLRKELLGFDRPEIHTLVGPGLLLFVILDIDEELPGSTLLE